MLNRTAEEVIAAMKFCVVDRGASGFLIGDNEMARVVAEWELMKEALRGSADEDLEAIKNEHIAIIRKREVWMIVRSDYGFQVQHWMADGVAPQSEYDTPHEAAARVLQLLDIKDPVTPQDWPEECCIGTIETGE